MPKVLTRLRIDEISCVTKGAGADTRVVLMKRHDPRPSVSYHDIFARKDNVQKTAPRFRGVSGRKIHLVENLTLAEAKSFLLYDPAGRTLLRDTGGDIDTLADHLVEASKQPTKREVPKMNVNKIDKTLREIGEAGFTKMIMKYANTVRLPNETQEQAFTRVFAEQSDEGQALRKCWQISKGVPVAEPDEEDIADEEEADKDREEDEDAMEELERLAREEQQRTHGTSKAIAFTKVYTDPKNAELVKRERRQSLAKMMPR